jgi:glycosyltransferase involved in cell wall biosynthesis
VDTERFGRASRATARAALGLLPTDLVVGTAGRLVPVKDQRTRVEAIGRLSRPDRPVILLVAGDGPLREVLTDQAAALGISAEVRLLGHRTDPEQVMAALDVFVLSSVSEGMSNTILEAMATGLPVVATRVGGANELVQEGVTGHLVPPRDPTALAVAIEHLLQSPDTRAALGAAARHRVAHEFSLGAMIRSYDDLYESLRHRIAGK